jgi:hypothetical protein
LLKLAAEPAVSASQEVALLRESLGHHFDVVVVIWFLTLAVGWSFVMLSHSDLRTDQWSSAPQSGPAWVISGDTSAQ